jgi:2-methylisocitrate lyase-like PEP mutase family enzyme
VTEHRRPAVQHLECRLGVELDAPRVGADADLMALLEESAAVAIPRALDDAVARLQAYRDAGVDRIMLQHLRHADVEAIAEIPRLSAALA